MAALQQQHRRSDRLLRLLSLPKPDPSPYSHSSPSVFDEEELDESDIFSAEESFRPNPNPNPNPIFHISNPNPNTRSFPMAVPKSRAGSSSSEKKVLRQSAPVSVPMMRRIMDEEEEEEEEGVPLPLPLPLPAHEMMAARIAGKGGSTTEINFSVVEGAGRTLKGRDLRRVRNAVFQKTGFLD